MGIFKGSGRNMETKGSGRNSALDNLSGDQKIESINHDDNKTGKVIQHHCDIEELFGIGHCKKNPGKRIDNFKHNVKYVIHIKRLFSDMRMHLLSWFTFIVDNG